MTRVMRAAIPFFLLFSTLAIAGDHELVRADHYVPVKSAVPFIEGQTAQIYVREVVMAGPALRSNPDSSNVVLFVHGAGTPAEVAFDVPYQDYSWMAYLADAGYDVFSMDMTGYGRSTRPTPMNDRCNLSEEDFAELFPDAKACSPSYPNNMTTMGSDWHDIDVVVSHLMEIRGVNQVNLVAWSLGGPRAGGYAAQHPEKVRSLVLLAPAYFRDRPSEAPKQLPAKGSVMTKQTRRDFIDGWDAQIGCEDQFVPGARNTVWAEMLASDPVGATWGSGVRRAPSVTNFGFGKATVSKMTTPTLMVVGDYDTLLERVGEMYGDLGSPKKVLAHLPCSGHNAMWETNHLLLFEASRQWIAGGMLLGTDSGELKLAE